MKSELLNEFYLLQKSRVANKYQEVLEEQVYTPIKEANDKIKNVNYKMSSWISERGRMLMNLDLKLNHSLKHLRKKYLKF